MPASVRVRAPYYACVCVPRVLCPQARGAATRDDSDSPPVPVTVRQLEAIIRLSESFAKMSLTPVATLEHVEMAITLFTKVRALCAARPPAA
jgi:DNA replicative helicase MCM subunit Mcm2 (Cdc46/Mcm family)